MKPTQFLRRHMNGVTWITGFEIGGETIHGELQRYKKNGEIEREVFYFNGLRHGDCHIFDEDKTPILHFFCIHGEEIDVPTLPNKPKRKWSKSNRTRYQTLEI